MLVKDENSYGNPLLGFTSAFNNNPQTSEQERDLKERSIKKVKPNEITDEIIQVGSGNVNCSDNMKNAKESITGTLSYKDSLLNAGATPSVEDWSMEEDNLPENRWVDSCPEPPLLATNVGKEHGGASDNGGESEKEPVHILNKEATYAYETKSLSEAQNQNAIIMQDQVIMEVDASNKNIESNTEGQKAHFGPWMLVKRFNPARGRFPTKDSNGKSISKYKSEHSIKNLSPIGGSRYASLAEVNDPVKDSFTAIRNVPIVPQVGQGSQMIKEIRVRNANGGKNSQQKDNNKRLGPGPKTKPVRNTPVEKETKPISDPKLQVESNQSDASTREDARMTMKEKEQQILHRMRILSKEGSNFFDQYTTHVVLPNQETINFLHNGTAQFINE
ncbi:hypothetical protein RIF29_14370 [Crotalaria pallida]|uniref:Uncharacterized protein n=1 Tax=Crotalaria pallida TaxID=3830 RepID=A0AAN9FDR2_CROPI